MRKLVVSIISFYQKILSLDTGFLPLFFGLRRKTCMFYPTCSEYTKQAVKKYGTVEGTYLGILRIGRCHPGNTPSVDEVP